MFHSSRRPATHQAGGLSFPQVREIQAFNVFC